MSEAETGPEPGPARDAKPVVPPAAQAPSVDALLLRKARDAALALPFLGILLFCSPLLNVAARDGTILGIPLSVAYIFGSWFLLIALVAWLSRRLARGGDA